MMALAGLPRLGRRRFIQGAVAAALLPALVPRLGEAAGNRRSIPRVGVLGDSNPVGWFVRTAAADIECRWADERRQRLPDLAAELVRLDMDVIVAIGLEAARAAKSATTTIPIVFVAAGDPVRDGLVRALARPGENVTGITVASGADMAAARLELLRGLVPRMSRIAVLSNAANQGSDSGLREVREAAGARGVEVESLRATTPHEVGWAFAEMARRRVEAVAVLSDIVFAMEAGRIAALAAEARLPAVYEARCFVEAGGLMSVHADGEAVIQRTVATVRRILGGERPAIIPVQPLSRLELTLNRRAARALGLALPPSLLARADTMIPS
jgi:putative tryptophan/tyrosine transport system substrate-binding protein